jgi:hypothetical protein
MTMITERLEDLSVVYFVKDLFSAIPFVTVVDEFPSTNLVIPTVAVDTAPINIEPGELGNRHGIRFRFWNIDIFAINKSQRDDFAYKILYALEDGIPIYDYNLGFPPTVVPQLTCLIPEDLSTSIVKVYPELVDKMYWRSTVSFRANRNTI